MPQSTKPGTSSGRQDYTTLGEHHQRGVGKDHDLYHTYSSEHGKGGYPGWRGQPALGKPYSSEGHHSKGDARNLSLSIRTSIGPKHPQLDSHSPLLESRLISKLFTDHSSLESTPVSSEVSTPVNDPGDRGSPAGASSPSTTPNYSLKHQDLLPASSSDSKLSMGVSYPYRRETSADTLLHESKTDPKLHSQRGDGSSLRYAGQQQQASGMLPQGMRHNPGKLVPRQQEQSSLASVSYNYQHSWAKEQWQKSMVALRISQFNQNGNHSGGSAPGEGQGGKREKGSPSEEKKGVRGKEKTPSPKTVKSPEHVSMQEKVPRGTERRASGGRRPSNLGEMSPSSSLEELSMINEEESDEVDAGLHQVIKPEAVNVSKTMPYQKPPPPPSSHPHPPHPHTAEPYSHLPASQSHLPSSQPHLPSSQPHPYPYDSSYTPPYGSSPASRAPPSTATKLHHDQLAYAQMHASYGHRAPPYHKTSHMTGHPGTYVGHRPPNVQHPGYAKLPRPELHSQPLGITKANIALAHDAASKGDVNTLVSVSCVCMCVCVCV